MKPDHRILVVDDKRDLARGVALVLSELSSDITVAHAGDEALRLMQEQPAELLITDVRMPGLTGDQLLAEVRRSWPRCRVILLTAFGTVEQAVAAMKIGATDYLTKPFDNDELLAKARRALEDVECEDELFRLRAQVEGEQAFHGIHGRNRRMRAVFEMLERIAPSMAPVMVCGESGTGKELVVRALHELGPRATGPLIAFNASALPDTLAEAELFGARKGSYTGATCDRNGLFVEASGGTLFIDELQSMSPALQGKLLRVVQEREVTPLGSARPVPVDVRLVSALNCDPQRLVRDGVLRQDLYFRLSVVRIPIPPLRERIDDIPLLANQFLERHAERSGGPPKQLSPGALRVLLAHDWPGNVRELQNVIERAALMTPTPELGPGDLVLEDDAGSWQLGLESPRCYEDAKRDVVESFQRRYVQRLLEETGGNMTAAAREAGITRAALYRMLKRLGLSPADAGAA